MIDRLSDAHLATMRARAERGLYAPPANALAPLIEARVREAQADAWDEGYAKGFYRAQTIHNDDPDRERDASEFDDPNPFYEEVRRNA